jgi:site-specific DNA-methyltransferase (cytosine-N4-specific)
MKHSDLPFGSEFSPSQIELPTFMTFENQTQPKISRLLQKPLSTILEEVRSRDKCTSVLALEALAFHLMRPIGLAYIGTRWKKGKGIQVFGQRSGFLLERWLFFCTNKLVNEDEVATEVGLMGYFGCSVACIVSTKKFLERARRYVGAVRSVLPGALVLIDAETLRKITHRQKAFVETIMSQAPFVLVGKA